VSAADVLIAAAESRSHRLVAHNHWKLTTREAVLNGIDRMC
jgi:hypothetical protein